MIHLKALLESLRSIFGSATLNISGKLEYSKQFKPGDWIVLVVLGVAILIFIFRAL